MLSACSFSSFSEGRGSAGVGDADEEMSGTGVEDPHGGTSSGGVADGGDGGGTEPPMTTGAPPSTTLPPADPDGGAETGGRGESSSGTGSDHVDPCGGTSTFELGADDGVLTDPMVVVDVTGLGPAAYSTSADAGDISFTIDVQCPGTYYLHAQVVDSWAGVHGCCDPDSYDVSWPGGSGSWFYGCQTESDGWHWLPVMQLDQGASCDDAAAVSFDLAMGEQTITFHNREGRYWQWGTVAAIANVAITNDAEYDGDA
jgi:hypothetical protein